ncbi:undecaprenyl-diphosphate phosphatase [Pseudomonas sp. NCCP-436]|uniref:undecaprenyl-diphosphate phosphatase n=1 Tax=Pseudomonas sp. NCCP-436 TaxID=2842481 RepID=UPI001C7E88F6|nr:undecaprenyl-diphosphate phosphatase [Pseudomonas sp. NCCP-436]
MDIWVAFQALILGVIEGLTEFLPVSSTGHLIVAGDLLGFKGEKATAFKIIIQLGAILAVIWEFRERILSVVRGLPREHSARRFSVNLLIAFLPAAIIGLLFADFIEYWLFNPITVASALILGGVIMIWAEKRQHTVRVESVEDMNWVLALKVGFAQCLAMIPGTSRSGATIIGGLALGLSRKAATEFSFFLAMPTMIGATTYSLFKYRESLQWSDLPVFAIGFGTTFVVAMLTVRALLKFIASHSYQLFAWYRIAFGMLILATWQLHVIDWSTARS